MQFHQTSVLFRDAFGTPEMREIFGDVGYLERFLEVEAALARAQADVGIVPESAAAEITERASLEYLDMERVAANVEEIGLFTMSIIDAWKDSFGDAGEYIHWGATSQDISDTAVVLQLRDAYERYRSDLLEIRATLRDLASEHRDTPMIGRTHFVHALPTTFGLKAAVWLEEVERHIDRLDAAAERAFVVEFFGATGTLASLERGGEEVQENLAAELDLVVPDTPWFAARDRFAEFLSVLAQIGSGLSKIAHQILLLNRPEFGEVSESIPEGEVGSSTMPHKRNPVRSEFTGALAKLLRANATAMLEATETYDERDFTTWYVEFAVIPDSGLYFGRVLENCKTVLTDLDVHPDGMRENLAHHGSLVASEAIMMALASKIGRQTAHDVVHENAMRAIQSDRDLLACLRDDERVTDAMTDEELEAAADPTNYVGLSAEFVDRTLRE
uniref:adenylosuccinate lyase n=1 Tax=Haloprofundus sp. MHR1 TaxID=2572921 RepID=UPI001F1C1D3D|nr:adenylosuccinate lyase [Haloprofundus sp. MHR1]